MQNHITSSSYSLFPLTYPVTMKLTQFAILLTLLSVSSSENVVSSKQGDANDFINSSNLLRGGEDVVMASLNKAYAATKFIHKGEEKNVKSLPQFKKEKVSCHI